MKCEWWTRRSVCEEVSAEWNDGPEQDHGLNFIL